MSESTLLSRLSGALVLGLVGSVAALTSCSTNGSQKVTTTTFVYEIGSKPDHASSHSAGTQGREDTESLIGDTFVKRLPFRSGLVRGVNAVFIGVSNFSPESGKIPTPAHSIGASYVETIFRQAVERTPSDEKTGELRVAGVHIERSELKLVTDLRLNPKDVTWRAGEVALVLDLLEEHVNEYRRGSPLPQDGLWPYQGNNEPLTKARILQIARDQADELSRSEGISEKIAIFYLATHGRLGPDGKRYAMAGDSTRDLSTWIRYDEIADMFHGTRDGKPGITALVIFDTCLESDTASPVAENYVPPDGTLVVSAAAPGQYSWHWGTKTPVNVLKDVKERGLITRDSGHFDASFYSSMSVVPIALADAIREAEIDCANHPSDQITTISAVNLVQSLRKSIPTLTQSEGEDRHQTVEVFFSEVTRQRALADTLQEQMLFGLPCRELTGFDQEELKSRSMMASARINAAISEGRIKR